VAVKEKFKNRAGKLTGEGEKANLLQKIKRKLIDFFSGRCTIEKIYLQATMQAYFHLAGKTRVEPPMELPGRMIDRKKEAYRLAGGIRRVLPARCRFRPSGQIDRKKRVLKG